METIAVALRKGGVGKTTLAVNLAAGMARAGRRVLLVDADSQAHATRWFAEPGTVDLDLRDVINGTPAAKVISSTRIDRLDLLPATTGLAGLDAELTMMRRQEDQVERALRPIRPRYDYAVVDLPPALSLTVVAVLVAADSVLVPLSASQLSIEAFTEFASWSGQFCEEVGTELSLLGIVVTMADARSRIYRQTMEYLTENALPRFRTVLPRRLTAEYQAQDRVVVGDPGMPAGFNGLYRDLVTEALERLEGRDV